ncbi:ABC transporter ATP-binding protein [Clostridium magnum]|uniref:Oligopeptide transport ATP-binding protein OppD n=1 Tax=Clostridium magnum DSM 2767 TaxID=1121326 RepID=A0A162SZM6_9CLOT|nr:ABC transporter ATP-binding protein [Clostridium magnum]KZL92063.1 oligopeptide transport ATP-binding protein OppD [Clostridium magnum DSM 2767]SHH23966.1 ABC-type dipeptide/oligopeptide/nickel transport system, ATPase component [Clostridium magnum DSM 2767]
MISMKILDINNLSVRYGKQEPTVKNINMSVNSKEIIGIVGESGSGKSTLIRAVLGLLPKGTSICSGDIVFKDKNLLKYSKKEWQELRGNRMAMIFQNAGGALTPIRKIGDQFIESIRSHFNMSKGDAYTEAVQMLEKLRLPDAKRIMNSYPFELSGGMKQRVGIAMAMTMEPEILLADEPTSALDATVQAQVVRQMMELRNNFNTSIIIVTHNIGVAAYMCDKIGVMQQGELVEWGSKEQVINNPKCEYTKKLLAAIPELEGRNLASRESADIEDKECNKAV